MAHPTKLEVMQAKVHRSLLRGVAFLLFASGLSLILYTLPPLVQVATQAAVVYKLQTAVAAPAEKF